MFLRTLSPRAALLLVFALGYASAGPTDGTVTAGDGQISTTGSTTTITQTSDRLSVDWASFDIGVNETVRFYQPSSSSLAVNRIGDLNGTRIQGTLSANGQVYLINPQGIIFGKNAQVNVRGLVASTLSISDQELGSSSRVFSGHGQGSIVNRGTMVASSGGYLALLGARVENTGSMSAPGGTVALGAGSRIKLDFSGDHLLNLAVEENVLAAQAANGGLIRASGGAVLLSAGARDSLVSSVVNNTGIIEAQTAQSRDGKIVLLGGMAAGTTSIEGTLDASAPDGGNGGFIETSAAHVKIGESSRVTTRAASGKTGLWLIDPNDFTIAATGGDLSGATLGTMLSGSNVTITSASGATSGNGDIFVNDPVAWSANLLTLSASRNISLNSNLTGTGSASLALLYGQGAVAAANSADYTIASSVKVALPAGSSFSTKLGSDGTTLNYTVITALGNAGSTSGTDLQGMGGDLTGLYALGADIDATATSGWNAGAGFQPIGGVGTAFTGRFAALGHSVTGLTINRPGTDFVGLFGAATGSELRDLSLTGGSVTGRNQVGSLVGYLQTSTVTNLQNTGNAGGSSQVGGLVGSAATSSATRVSNSGTISGTNTIGGLVGYGQNVTVDQFSNTGNVSGSSYNVGGIAGQTSNSTLSNGSNTGTIHGNADAVGGLVGAGAQTTMTVVFNSGAISGSSDDVGGLIGYSDTSTISRSYNSGNVSAGTLFGGGIAGRAISNTLNLVYNTGTVTGSYYVGGVAGYMQYGTLAKSYNSGAIAGANFYVGGLAGYSELIAASNVYNTGSVSGVYSVGGLIGDSGNHSSITYAYNTGSVSGTLIVGGLVGYNDQSSITHAYNRGAVSATNQIVGGVAGYTDQGTMSYIYSTGAVSGTSIKIGGLVGLADGASLSNSYWDITTSGLSGGVGEINGGTNTSIGLSTSQLQDSALLAGSGWDAAIWAPSSAGYYLELYSLSRVIRADASKSYGDTTATLGSIQHGGTATYVFAPTGDSIAATSVASSGTRGTGTYAYTTQTVSSVQGDTYRLIGDEVVGTRAITVVADGKTKAYGDANPALTYSVTVGNLVNGDSFSGAITTTADGTSIVGNYDITQGTLGLSANYGLTFTPGTLSVTARPITVTADSLTKLYGNANPSLTYSVTTGSLVNGDTFAGAVTTTADGTSGIGNYGIAQGSLALSANYGLTFTPGTLSVTARPITVTADSLTKLYGNANPSLTYSVTTGSLVNGDTFVGAITTTATGTSGVGSYGITQGTLGLSANYGLTFTPGALSVTARPITVTADSLTKLYGNANPTLTYGITSGSLVNGDSFSGAITTAADGTSGVGNYGITQGSLGLSANYGLTFTPGALSVTARPITVTADSLTKLYGNANPSLTYSVTTGSLVNGDTFAGAVTTSADGTSGIGNYGITQGSLGLSANYGLTFTPGTLSVTARPITVTADSLTKLYGNANPSLTYSVTTGSLVNGDSFAGAVTTTADGTSGIGSYGITQGTLALSANYGLTFTPGTLSVTARPITVTADSLTKLYGNANPSLTYSVTTGSLVNGDTFAGAITTTATGTSGVGSYGITQGTLGLSANYGLTFTPGALSVTARPITVVADGKTKTYGDANPGLTYSVTAGNLVNGDTFAGAVTTSATSISNVGSYDITQGSLALSANYGLTFTPGTLSVTARPITVTADSLTKLYGNANPSLTYSVTTGSLVNGDTFAGAITTAADGTSNVGSYGITQGTLGLSANYGLTFTPGTLSVTARPITVTADSLTKLYGNANPTLTYSVTTGSLVNGDTFAGAITTAADGTSGVGNYGITQGTLGLSANYGLTFTPGTLSVTARPVSVTADSLTKLYGNANPSLTFGITSGSLVNGDTFTGAITTAANGTSGVGSYGITQGSLALSANYGLTFTPGTLSVTARPITVTADSLTKLYGNANPSLTYSVTAGSLVNGDTFAGAVTTTADGISGVGSYSISQGSLALSANYGLTFTPGTLSVTARPITVTADSLTKLYGNANPSLTYSVTTGSLVNGDTFAGAITTAADGTSGVGNYGITQGTLGLSANYGLTFTPGTLSVTARPITVTADSLTKLYGNANPSLTYSVTAGSLVNGDTFSGSLATTATNASRVGTYDITQGSLGLGANYGITFTSSTLSVAPRSISVAADNQAKYYGTPNPNLTYRVTEGSLVNGDSFIGTLATNATASSTPGDYLITQGGLALGTDYTLSFAGGVLKVTDLAPEIKFAIRQAAGTGNPFEEDPLWSRFQQAAFNAPLASDNKTKRRSQETDLKLFVIPLPVGPETISFNF